MSPQYLLIYGVILVPFILIMRRWKRRLKASGKGTSVPYAIVCGVGGAAMGFLGLMALLYSLLITKNWYIFTEKRRDFVADRYGITEGDGLSYYNYSVKFGGPDGSIVTLQLTCDGDVRTALEAHCRGEFTMYTENGELWYASQDRSDPDEQPVDKMPHSDGMTEYYEYQYGGARHIVYVYETEDGTKRITIR